MNQEQFENWRQTVDELRETESLLQFNLDMYTRTQELTYLEKILENVTHMLLLIPLRNRYYEAAFR